MSIAPRKPAPRSPQAEFNFLMPAGHEQLLKVEKVCGALNRKRGHIYALLEEGKLEGHEVLDRTKAQKRVTRDSLSVLLMETATYKPADLLPRITALFSRFTTQEEITAAIAALAKRRASL